jgi:mannose-1-phosphate guanylyltransferase
MEPAGEDERITMCAVDMSVYWTDVGSWPAYGETLQADEHGCCGNTKTVHLDSKNVLAVSDDPEHAITTIGCSDLIIVHTADATLVCRAEDAQRVKEMTTLVDETLR